METIIFVKVGWGTVVSQAQFQIGADPQKAENGATSRGSLKRLKIGATVRGGYYKTHPLISEKDKEHAGAELCQAQTSLS